MFAAVTPERALLRLTYGESEMEFLKSLEEFLEGARLEIGEGGFVRDEAALAQARRELSEYFRGERTRFSLPVDLRTLTPFQQEVLRATCRIPYGEAWSYGDVAAAVGRPRGARAVGQALSQNPICVVIPCHRVVASDGSLHGYSGAGGIETKRRLLELEGCLPARMGSDMIRVNSRE